MFVKIENMGRGGIRGLHGMICAERPIGHRHDRDKQGLTNPCVVTTTYRIDNIKKFVVYLFADFCKLEVLRIFGADVAFPNQFSSLP
jgi:hypothetical protein